MMINYAIINYAIIIMLQWQIVQNKIIKEIIMGIFNTNTRLRLSFKGLFSEVALLLIQMAKCHLVI